MVENSGETKEPANASSPTKSPPLAATGKFRTLRVWPAVLFLVVMLGAVAARFLPSLADDGSMMFLSIVMMAPAALGLLIVVWWLAFSRANAAERIVGVIGIVLFAAATMFLSDPSMLGPALIIFTIPMGTAAFAMGAVWFRRNLTFKRTIVPILLAACGFAFTALLRSDGIYGTGAIDWQWRWESSPEERMLAKRNAGPTGSLADLSAGDVDAWLASPEWPGFRGRDGLSQQHGEEIAVDWTANPPEEIWRRPVGPGWSSFVVAGGLLFTQEQHGQQETVVCYSAKSGKEIWKQQIESRFFDPMGGPGPRATPTLAAGGLFATGANGQLQRLDPRTGEMVWMKDLQTIAGRLPPTWGFSASPLVTGSLVIVHAGGAGDLGTLAFDAETGDLVWSTAAGDHSYSTAQLGTIDGKQYVLMLTNTGLDILDPVTGESRLEYEWPLMGYRALQPQVIDGNSILIPTGPGMGTRRIRITSSESGLTAEEEWTSLQMRPDYNDFVIHENHAYGFDGAIFTCLDLATGQRKWKGGRYGKGQVLLLADSGHLLVATEKGDVVLLPADPSGHRELTRFNAIEGRTWNHPVVVGDRLYIRNSEEAACYRLPLANSN